MCRCIHRSADVTTKAKENIHILNGNAENLEEECRHYEQMIEEAGGIDLFIGGIGHVQYQRKQLSVDCSNQVYDKNSLDSATRSQTQDDFLMERIDVIVATIKRSMPPASSIICS